MTATKLGSRLAELATTATVISPEQIRLGTSRTVYGALAAVPGAHLFDLSGSETQGMVEARGFASQGQSSHLLVLVDEIPINEIEGDRVDWNLLAQGQLERVEFLRGPASFLYGNESMAGVVNLVTRQPGAGPSAWFEGAGGTEGRGGGAGGAAWRDDRTQASLSGSYRSEDGFRDHSAWRNGGGYGFVRTALSPGIGLSGRLLVQRNDQEIPGPLPDPDWRDDPKRTQTPLDDRDVTTIAGGLEIAVQAAPALELVGLFSADGRDLDATETIIPAGTLDRTSQTRALRGELRAHWKPADLPLPHVMFGGEIERGTLESRYFDPSAGNSQVGAGDVERLSGAVFALAVARLHERLSLTAGVRADWLRSSVDDPDDAAPRGPNDDLRALSPTVGLNWSLPGASNAYVSYARAFKAPTLEQLYDPRPFFVDFDGPGGQPPFVLRIANNALQPQRGDHFDLGARTALGSGLWLDLATYYARSRDEIGFDLANFRHRNIDRSTHYGLEAGVSVGLWAALTGQVSYSYTRATFDGGDHDGKQINTVPEHQIYVRATAHHSYHGAVTAEVTHVRDQWIDEDSRFELPDYTSVDLGVNQPVAGIELFGAVRNLFDERYATLGFVTLDQFGQDLPLYFPAMGRSFQLGLRLRTGESGR